MSRPGGVVQSRVQSDACFSLLLSMWKSQSWTTVAWSLRWCCSS